MRSVSIKSYTLGAACALAAVVAAAPAQADVRDLGVIAEGTTKGAVIAHSAGSFSDSILFSITKGGADGFASYFNFLAGFPNNNSSSNLKDTFLTLTGPSSYSFALTDNLVKQLSLAAGSYTANVTGTVVGSDGGAYNLRIAAPTPEPEVWLSMLAGTAMAGFMARRRKRSAANAA